MTVCSNCKPNDMYCVTSVASSLYACVSNCGMAVWPVIVASVCACVTSTVGAISPISSKQTDNQQVLPCGRILQQRSYNDNPVSQY